MAVVANFGFNLLVTFIFPTMLEDLGSSWTFAIFAVIDVFSLYFIKTRVRYAVLLFYILGRVSDMGGYPLRVGIDCHGLEPQQYSWVPL